VVNFDEIVEFGGFLSTVTLTCVDDFTRHLLHYVQHCTAETCLTVVLCVVGVELTCARGRGVCVSMMVDDVKPDTC